MRRSTSIDALIKLIDDPDLSVFEQVRAEILRNGDLCIPKLSDMLFNEFLDIHQVHRIENLLKELRFKNVLDALESWSVSSEKNLLQGLHIILSYQFPELTVEQLEDKIHFVERRIWLEVNRRLTAFENVERVNTMWFQNIGMQVVAPQTSTPFHTFVNTVLEDLSGTPLSVGLLYSIIAQRLNLPIYGVNFPGQFVLAYIDEFRIHKLIEPLGTGGVLFYIIPEQQGKVVIRKQLEEHLTMSGQKFSREYFEPCSHSSLLMLYLDELIQVYERLDRSQDAIAYQSMKERLLDLA